MDDRQTPKHSAAISLMAAMAAWSAGQIKLPTYVIRRYMQGQVIWSKGDGTRLLRNPASKGGQCCKCASYAKPKCKALGRPVRRKKSGRNCYRYERRA